ncbi:MAG: peptidyl-prolyl cis-trans isomerase [Patulibacter minatonensis]
MKTPRRSLLSVLPVLAVALSACGGPKAGDVAVIKTDNGDIEISKAQYDRFFDYGLVRAQQKASIKDVTPLVAPDFKACVDEARKAIPAESQRKKTSDATLRKTCKETYDTTRNTALQQVINLDWLVSEAGRRGVTIRKAAVARELNSVVTTQFQGQKGYDDFLKSSGLTSADIDLNLRGKLANDLILAQIQKDVKAPTDIELRRYFEEKSAQFTQPETRDLRLIKVADEATAKTVRAELEKGGSWKTLAQKYSTDDATKANGGIVLGATADTQPPEFGATVFKAKSGELLQPVKTSLGWYVVRVQKITAEVKPKFADVKAQIEQTLQQTQSNDAVEDFKNLFLARWAARTTCADGYDDLVACGGDIAKPTTPETLPVPPGAGVPQFPKPKADPNAVQLDPAAQQQVQTSAG